MRTASDGRRDYVACMSEMGDELQPVGREGVDAQGDQVSAEELTDFDEGARTQPMAPPTLDR